MSTPVRPGALRPPECHKVQVAMLMTPNHKSARARATGHSTCTLPRENTINCSTATACVYTQRDRVAFDSAFKNDDTHNSKKYNARAN